MNDSRNPTLSVIIPAFNESDRIKNSLYETCTALANTDYEIIVVDDGSSDLTSSEALNLSQANENIKVFRLPLNRGKGAALVFGCHKARGDLIAFLDADLELHPSLLLQFWRIMVEQDADAVIGSKRHPNSQLNYPPFRRITSISYALMNRWLFGLNLYDTQTGIKLFRASVIKRVINRLRIERYAFDLELLVAISRFGYKIIEAPVILKFQRQHGGRLRLSAIAGMFIDTIQIYYWASFWKWLEPSLRMKIWIAFFLVGIILGSFGLAHWLAVHVRIPENLSMISYLLTLRFLDTKVRDWIMIFFGAALVIVSGIQLNKGVLAAFARADRGYTIDQKFETEIKKSEIPLPPEE